MAKTRKPTSKKHQPTTVDAAALIARSKHHPGVTPGRNFAASRLPAAFQTVIDPSKHPAQPFRNLPPPTGQVPFHLSLGAVLSQQAMQTIKDAGRMNFHCVGDTGGVNTPTQIENVASFMERDFSGTDVSVHPSFFYHLGDVVYYDGETANYYPEFYEPYNTYPAPIFAIPGNHDGDVNPQTGETTLQGFVNNFCARVPAHRPEAQDALRDAMTQPNVYWTLDTPLGTIVGLYSNCPEGGELRPDQIAWLESELKKAPASKALIVAVHHPVYSAYGAHPGSQHLYSVLDNACTKTGRVPHLVRSGHVHYYQRFTGSLAGKQLPFIVAGAGGYNAKLHTLAQVFHTSKLPISMTGSGGVLESFCDSNHGYLLVRAAQKSVQCDYFAVPDPGAAPKAALKPFDSVTVAVS